MCCGVSPAHPIFQVHIMSCIDGENRHHLKYTRQYDWYVDIHLNNWTSLNPTLAGARGPTLSQRIWFPWSRSSLHSSIDSSLDNIVTFLDYITTSLFIDLYLYFVQDVVDTHPGLLFLKEATEFHSRYVHTVSDLIHHLPMKFTPFHHHPHFLQRV